MNIQLVGVSKIDEVWPVAKQLIGKSLKYCDDLSISGLYALCRSGRGFLFVSDDLQCSAVVSFERQGEQEAARILALGSRIHTDWKEEINSIKHFAKMNGADKVVFQGRKGWQRVFGDNVKTKIQYHYEV